MNVTIAPFDDVNVRLALKWAFDREEIVRKIAFGYGAAGNDNPISPSLKFSTNPSPVFHYDPDKAKFHLREAGLSSLDIDLSASDVAFEGAVDTAVLMKEHAARAGININVVREAADGYWDNVWMKKPWCMSSWFGRPTCDGTFSIAYARDASWNDTSWRNPRFNELLLLGRAEADETKRAAIYAEMQQLVHDDGGMIVLMFSNFVSAHSKAVSHGDLNSNFDLDGGKLLERWWFA
jgi:peptide/nickel transport system substrate-binding protein